MSGGRGVQDCKGLGRGRCLSVTLEVQVYVCWVSIQYINQNWRNFGVNSNQSLNSLSTSSQLPFSCNVDARNPAIWPHRPICECWVPVFFWLGLLLVSLSCCAAGRVWLSRLSQFSQCELVSGEAVQQAMRTDPWIPWCEQRGENYLAMEQLTGWNDDAETPDSFCLTMLWRLQTDPTFRYFQPSWSKLAFKVWIAGWRISAANCQWFQRYGDRFFPSWLIQTVCWRCRCSTHTLGSRKPQLLCSFGTRNAAGYCICWDTESSPQSVATSRLATERCADQRTTISEQQQLRNQKDLLI